MVIMRYVIAIALRAYIIRAVKRIGRRSRSDQETHRLVTRRYITIKWSDMETATLILSMIWTEKDTAKRKRINN